VNRILDNSRLSLTENLKTEHVQSNRPIHTGTPDTIQTGPSCREFSRPDRPTSAFSVSGSAGIVGATAGRTPTQNEIRPTALPRPHALDSVVAAGLGLSHVTSLTSPRCFAADNITVETYCYGHQYLLV